MQSPPAAGLTALKEAVDRHETLCSLDPTKWTELKSQAIPRSSRLILYKLSNEPVYKAVYECTAASDRSWTTSDWWSLFRTVETRKLWDQMIDSVKVLSRRGDNICITQTTLRDQGDSGSDQDANGTTLTRVEKTSRSRNRIRHITTTFSAAPAPASPDVKSFLAVYDIRIAPADSPNIDSRITLYFEWPWDQIGAMPNQNPEAYGMSLITGPLSVLSLHGAPPVLSRSGSRDRPSLHIKDTGYQPDTREWSATYHFDLRKDAIPASASSSSLVDSIRIRQSPNSHHRLSGQWHSASWDYEWQSSLQIPSSLGHRKNSFMSSSILLPPSSPSSYAAFRSTQAQLTAGQSRSYSDQAKPHSWSSAVQNDNAGLAISTGALEDSTELLVLELDSDVWARRSKVNMVFDVKSVTEEGVQQVSPSLLDRFAQLCIRCHQYDKRHIIIIGHPSQLTQYLEDEERERVELNRPDGDDESDNDVGEDKIQSMPTVRVNEIIVTLQLQASPDDTQRFELNVNGKHWPVRSQPEKIWSTEDEADESSTSDDENSKQEESEPDQNVFPGSMDDIPSPTPSDTEEAVPASPEPIPLEVNEAGDTSEPSSRSLSPIPDDQPDTLLIPDTDPPVVLKMHGYFDTLADSDNWRIVQKPENSNYFVTNKKLDISGHPTGAFMSESTWKDCSIWDVKAVVSCVGTRKLWDSTFEEGAFVLQATPTCSIWHNKLKGLWFISPRDIVAFMATYTSTMRIDICATSCPENTYLHQTLPPEAPGHVRAHLDLWAWRFDRVDSTTTSVKFITQANPQGLIPSYIPNSVSPTILTQAHQFFDKYGAPPSLEKIYHGQLVNVSYDHRRRSWRCEYLRPATPKNKATESPSTNAEIRLGDRRRANNQYHVVIDPPPSRVRASGKAHDQNGIWLYIEHDEDFIIPQLGKILVLIKPAESMVAEEAKPLLVNGIPTPVRRDHTKAPPDPIMAPVSPLVLPSTALETTASTPTPNSPPVAASSQSSTSNNAGPPQPTVQDAVAALPFGPMEYARAAFTFLIRNSEQQFGWSNSVERQKLQLSKRIAKKALPQTGEGAGETSPARDMAQVDVPESVQVIKASKVIEGFSLDEVASVVTDIGNLRLRYDDTIESIEPVADIQSGCSVVQMVVKGFFLVKSREAIVCRCIATENTASATNPTSKRIFYIEYGIPDFPKLNTKKLRTEFFFSGWILEAIDPYTTTTNHPIPSMRATYVASMDLGSGVPIGVSNFVTSGFFKKIYMVESCLKAHGPPPFLLQPSSALEFVSDDKSLKPISTDMKWIKVQHSLDITTHCFKVKGTIALPMRKTDQVAKADTPKSNLSVSILKQQQQQQQQQQQILTVPGSDQRRDSIPSSVANSSVSGSPNLRAVQASTETASRNPVKATSQSLRKDGSENTFVLLECIVDLQKFPKGYEVNVHLASTHNNADLSGLLTVRITELPPEPSHLIGKRTPRKHAIRTTVQRLALEQAVSSSSMEPHFTISFDLARTKEEYLKTRGTRLTVSGVLGEEEESVITVNGHEVTKDTDIKITPSADATNDGQNSNTDPSLLLAPLSEENLDQTAMVNLDHDSHDILEGDLLLQSPQVQLDDTASPPGLMAAALVGVSASVNQIHGFRNRMLLPFRNASNSFMGSDAKEKEHESDLSDAQSSDEQDGESTPVLYRRRRATSSPEVGMRRRTFWLFLFPIVLLMFLLLMMLMMLVFFATTVTLLETPEIAGAGHRHVLWTVPWLRGWEFRVVLARRE